MLHHYIRIVETLRGLFTLYINCHPRIVNYFVVGFFPWIFFDKMNEISNYYLGIAYTCTSWCTVSFLPFFFVVVSKWWVRYGKVWYDTLRDLEEVIRVWEFTTTKGNYRFVRFVSNRKSDLVAYRNDMTALIICKYCTSWMSEFNAFAFVYVTFYKKRHNFHLCAEVMLWLRVRGRQWSRNERARVFAKIINFNAISRSPPRRVPYKWNVPGISFH